MKNETNKIERVDREKKIVNRKPNNSFILDDQSGCEVIEMRNILTTVSWFYVEFIGGQNQSLLNPVTPEL